MSDLRTLYPPIEPYESGMFDVGDGHQIYYERCGTPGAKPAVFLHGGPGAGMSPDHRRLFDPALYDVFLFDQRGCGKSLPYASLENNTTWKLVADIERFREYCGVDKWLVFGGSWGSTLSLSYAETHPDRTSELVVRGIFLGDKKDLDWLYQFGCSELFPEEWEAYLSLVPEDQRGNTISAYAKLLADSDPAVQLKAAQAWALWEGSTTSLLPSPERQDQFSEGHYAIAITGIENHFFVNRCWLEPGQLLRDARRLANIPTTIVHGRYDACCAVGRAWDLHKALPEADLRIVEAAGHVFNEPGILDELVRATDRYAGKD